MKQYSKLFSLVALLGATSSILHAADDNNNNGNRVLPFIQWRSQGRDMARKLYGETSYAIYQGDMDNNYGTFNVTVQYDQTFRGKELADCLFGPAIVNNDCDNQIVISGLNSVTGTATRAANEIMAENLLLPRDFKSTISFSPKIQDVVVDLHLFVGLDRWVQGLYFRLYGPIVWNRATLKPEENLINKGTTSVVDANGAVVDPAGTPANVGGGYQQGYLNPNAAVPTQALYPAALSYFGGCPFPVKSYNNTEITVAPLKFAKFSDCTTSTNNCDDDCNSFRHHKTGFAELRGEFGYNYIKENYRLLINLQAAAPTGSKVKAEYLFPAYIGNGKHWELGVGLGGAWRMWHSEDEERSFNFIVEADITHLFNAKQQMTFDLKCKPLSRYMLAEQLIDQTNVKFQLNPNTPIFDVDNGNYSPVANFSTRDVKVSFGVQADLVAMFNYTCRGFSWDLGYNFWALSSSKIKLSDNCDDSCGTVTFPTNMVLKGDSSVGGYNNAIAPNVDNIYYGLGASESAATIFKGVNAGVTNANIDNAKAAQGNRPEGPQNPVPLYAFPGTAAVNPINTSVDPVFISINDLDLEGAEQRGLSNKVFTHFSYTWTNHDRWVPYVGAGFSAEFGSHSGDDDCSTTTTTCDTCPSSLSCALSKWAVEIKGGVSFH